MSELPESQPSAALPTSDLPELTSSSASDLVRQIAKRHVSATEVVRAFLARVDQTNTQLNAICTLNTEAALAAAAQCDQRLASGLPARPLEGVPFVAKDNLDTRDLRTTYGALPFSRHVPNEDSICVARLRASGAILLGKTNTPEFASDVNTSNRLFGTTRNPWNASVSPGGSSGGTASAIAAAMAPIGLGTDLGGSLRVPASFCGLVGLRTVPGRIPVYPADFAWDTLVEHVHGPMALTVADAGLMLSVMAGADDRAPNSLPDQAFDYLRSASGEVSIKGRRLAFSADLGGVAPVDPEVAQLTLAAARRFESLGCTVEEAFPDVSDIRTIVAGTRAFGMVGRFGDYLASSREQMTEQLVRQVSDALATEVRAITTAERLRSNYYHRVRRLLQRYDYLLSPTVGVPPFRLDRPLPAEIGGNAIDRFYDVFLYTYAFSVTGLPVISVPCGFTRSGLPVGLQIAGPRLREDAVLEAAAAYLQTSGHHPARPRLDPDSLSRFAELPAMPAAGPDWISNRPPVFHP